jgi:hypothetical protein
MAGFIGFDKNVLIFTDRHFTAGGISDGSFPATILTRGSTLLLRDVFFPESGEQRTTPSQEMLIEQLSQSFPGLGEASRQAGETFLREVPFLVQTSDPPELGPVEVSYHETSEWLALPSGDKVYVPAGTLFRRTVGRQTVLFSTAAQSLAGVVKPNPALAVVDLDPAGVRVSLQQARSRCGHCGACGACGLCILCGEINFGVAGAASAALVAVVSIGDDLAATSEAVLAAKRAERPDRPVSAPPSVAAPRPPLATAGDLEQRLRPLIELAERLDTDDTEQPQ